MAFICVNHGRFDLLYCASVFDSDLLMVTTSAFEINGMCHFTDK